MAYLVYVIKVKIHSSCEIEYFVETHLCLLCVILRSRVLPVVCPYRNRIPAYRNVNVVCGEIGQITTAYRLWHASTCGVLMELRQGGLWTRDG